MAELSPLRRRMIEDMTIRNLSPATQRSYINAVSKLSRHFGRSPERLDVEDIRAFQVQRMLAQFTGSTHFYRHGLVSEVLYTEGVEYVVDLGPTLN
jgi:hypothetical protein